MTLLRCALLCMIACGSHTTPPIDQPIVNSGSAARPQPAPTAKPVAIAIVFEGWEMWVGNDQVVDDPNEQYLGALRPFQEALKRVALTDFPAGSQAAVVTYAETATTRHPMQPIEKLTPAAFGEQKDYVDTIDRNLVAGVTLGLDELAKVKDVRRVLLVIGDGTDTNPGVAKGAFDELAKRAAAENVEIVSFVYRAQLSPDSISIRPLAPNPQIISSVAGIVEQLDWLFVRLKQPPIVARPRATGSLALALVVSGAEIWMGNDDFIPAGDPSRYEGGLKPIRAAFEGNLLTDFPAGSTAMFETYDSTARVRVPMLPFERFDARVLGVQRDYYGAIGTELVSGLTLAFTELLKVRDARRVVVVIGDGADTNNDAAKSQLSDLAKRAAEYHIEVYAIVYKSALSSEGTVVTVIDPHASIAATAGDIHPQLVALFNRLRKR